jgi:hypothetical protein
MKDYYSDITRNISSELQIWKIYNVLEIMYTEITNKIILIKELFL